MVCNSRTSVARSPYSRSRKYVLIRSSFISLLYCSQRLLTLGESWRLSFPRLCQSWLSFETLFLFHKERPPPFFFFGNLSNLVSQSQYMCAFISITLKALWFFSGSDLSLLDSRKATPKLYV